ncbi:MAG: hypothetical protein ACR2O8_15245 [Rhizobiaceae bacterium]
MRWPAVFIFLFLWSPLLAQEAADSANIPDASAPDVQVRAYIEPEDGLYVGQLARLWIEVSSTAQFGEAPRYEDLKLGGAVVLMPDPFGVNFSKTERGQSYTGQRQRFVIIPQRDGIFSVPPLSVMVTLNDGTKLLDPVRVQTEALEFTATFPPEAEALGQILTTSDMTVDESYDREPEGLKVGDAIVRTVKMRADDTFALAMPVIEFAQVEGTRVYPAKPGLTDQTNRGQYSGERVESATYVFEKDGAAELPEIKIQWWNPDTKTLEEKVLPALELTIAVNPDAPRHDSPAATQTSLLQFVKQITDKGLQWLGRNMGWLTLCAIAAYFLVLAWRRYQPVVLQKWKDWQHRRLNSEVHYFQLFKRACRSGKDSEIAASFWRWMDRQSDNAGRLDVLMDSADASERERELLLAVKRERYGEPTSSNKSIDGMALYHVVKNLRIKRLRRKQPDARSSLVRLNP